MIIAFELIGFLLIWSLVGYLIGKRITNYMAGLVCDDDEDIPDFVLVFNSVITFLLGPIYWLRSATGLLR